MTQAVENTDSYYVANGATTTFGFTFSANVSSEVIVLTNGITATGYIFSSSFPITGGANVVFTVAPTNGTTISILRKTQLTQEANFDSTTAFLEAEHEKALDKMVRGQQDLARDVREKSVRLGDSNEGFPNGFIIPKPVAEDVGKLVVLNNNVPPDGFQFSGANIAGIDVAVATTTANAATAAAAASAAAGSASSASGSASAASASAAAAAASAGSASAIAAGSLYAYTTSSGTVTAVDGEGYRFNATGTINLPVATAGHTVRAILDAAPGATLTLVRNGGTGNINGVGQNGTIVHSGIFFMIADGANWLVTGNAIPGV